MRIGKIILVLALSPSLGFSEESTTPPIGATQAQGSNFQPSVMDKAPPKVTPAAQSPATKPGPTTPAATPGPTTQPVPPPSAQNPNPNGTTPPATPGPLPLDPTALSPEPPLDTNWDKYVYPDSHVFGYGGYGLKNIGNGLCVAKNKDRSQATQGYCAQLADIIHQPNTCAGGYAQQIISSPSPINGLERFCPTFGQLNNDQKLGMIQQVLSTLIVQESGWNPRAQEKPWVRSDGKSMGGKGLFQIGVDDRNKSSKYPDCSAINGISIFDPTTNMKCGACIALREVFNDKAMGHGTGDSGAVGMARYFGPLRDAQRAKRGSMENAVKQYCTAVASGGAQAAAYAPLSSGAVGPNTRTPTSTTPGSSTVTR